MCKLCHRGGCVSLVIGGVIQANHNTPTTLLGFVWCMDDQPGKYSGLLLQPCDGLKGCIFFPQEADLVLLIGTNPRFEAPLVNTRIRKRYSRNVGSVLLDLLGCFSPASFIMS